MIWLTILFATHWTFQSKNDATVQLAVREGLGYVYLVMNFKLVPGQISETYTNVWLLKRRFR